VARTVGTDGLADTSDPEAAIAMIALLDAALGLSV
jgi:L-cysteine:1D-myo-inositol 2-amino-2-deoxy-alpha-D-glucopyranoside ligase